MPVSEPIFSRCAPDLKVGDVTQCRVNDPNPESLKAIFAMPHQPVDWQIRTRSQGRAGNGRKNRGRILPAGKARRYMDRRLLFFNQSADKMRQNGLYEFLMSRAENAE